MGETTGPEPAPNVPRFPFVYKLTQNGDTREKRLLTTGTAGV